MTQIGRNIATRRKELGITQEELAEKMGYKSKSTINKIELGKNDIPQSKIAMFAKVLNTTPAYLMGWEEVKKNNDTLSDIANNLMDNPTAMPIVQRLLDDPDFLSLVVSLCKLDTKKMAGVKQMLDSFL